MDCNSVTADRLGKMNRLGPGGLFVLPKSPKYILGGPYGRQNYLSD